MLIQTQAPQIEPVSLAEAKQFCRAFADISDDDLLISGLIRSARAYAEMYCQRSFITQKWRVVLDAFPGPSLMGVPYGVTYSIPGHAITLERGTVQSVDSVQYLDAGVWKTMDPANYVAELSGCPGRITPVFGQIWPVISTPQIGNVKVDYTAGYGSTASTVPDGIRDWIKIRVSTIFNNRESVAVLQRGKVEPLPYVDSMLDPFTAARY
jgi:uncharacterized phiE125 gp8 family phage protein